MPRLKLTETEQQNRAFAGTLDKHKQLMNVDDVKVGEMLGVATKTVSKYRHKPETITLRTLRRFCKKMHISGEELCEIVGVRLERS